MKSLRFKFIAIANSLKLIDNKLRKSQTYKFNELEKLISENLRQKHAIKIISKYYLIYKKNKVKLEINKDEIIKNIETSKNDEISNLKKIIEDLEYKNKNKKEESNYNEIIDLKKQLFINKKINENLEYRNKAQKNEIKNLYKKINNDSDKDSSTTSSNDSYKSNKKDLNYVQIKELSKYKMRKYLMDNNIEINPEWSIHDYKVQINRIKNNKYNRRFALELNNQ